jgi:predicted Zn-dependent protease
LAVDLVEGSKMKKILSLFFVLLVGTSVRAEGNFEELFNYANTNMKNFWSENGKYEQKILDIGTKIINANKLDKRIAFQTIRDYKTINAKACATNKIVYVYYGILPYIDNDDELAAVLGHEMTHSLDHYGGFFKWMDMYLNSKSYETKADLGGIDLMVKAGYNPIAAICMQNKSFPEDYWDFWVFTSHPKTSKRLIDMYKYIYVKYPWALKTDMVHNVNYENFTYSSQKEINLFLQHEKERSLNKNKEDL